MEAGSQRNQEEKVSMCGVCYVFKQMKTHSLTVSSFALTPVCLIVFLFCPHFYLLSHLEIIRCVVKSVTTFST